MKHQNQQTALPCHQDPHPAWLEEWRCHSAECEQAKDGSPEGDAAWSRREDIARKLATVPVSSISGLAAQLAFVTEDLGSSIGELVGIPYDGVIQLAASGAAQIADEQANK